MKYLALLVVVPVLALAGCKTAPINFEAMQPASQADLSLLEADVVQDRTNTKAALDAVAADLAKAGIGADATTAAANTVQAKVDEVGARPPSGGIPGALIAAVAGSGIVPPWLDWALTLLGTAFGINVQRNRTRAKALAKVATPPKAPPA